MNKSVALSFSLLILSTLVCSGQPFALQQQPPRLTRILFVFDASESMADHWQSDTKYRTAVSVLSGILDSLQGNKNLEIGLRVYGPKRASGPDCEASYMMVPFGKDNFTSIKSVLQGLSPGGTTPIAFSLEQTVSDFTPCNHCRNVVILITDGLEACGGDPCQVSKRLQQGGIFLRPFIVGIGANMRVQFDCMGNYYNAANEKEYRRALETIVATSLKEASAQINLLDRMGKPTQTDVHVTLFDHVTGTPRYSFIHTLNSQGIPDTLKLDPLITYDVVVQTIPPLRKESVWIEPGKHTTIELDASQGFLRFEQEGERVVPCIIRRGGTGEAIHVQPSNTVGKYLAGDYDITVLTMPRMNFNQIKIAPDVFLQLTIPSPGTVTLKQLKPAVGSIYMEMEGDQEEAGSLLWVDQIHPDQPVETRHLQPGNYIIVYRLTSSAQQDDTREKRFTVEAGKNIEVEV
ncbi:MAG: VWA domain-containing protein [Bacteroidales bacterium]|nr:VWA domain-containing protein [Bacteroidales bacterium]